MYEIRFIDMFGGIGGFRLGLERASQCQEPEQEEPQKGRKRTTGKQGEGVLSRQNTSFRCVWYCDINRYAVQVYNKNFKENHTPTDITQVDASKLPDFDMLCGGFPCQSFSIAGKRKGFQDTRGTLFHEILRIASEKKPRVVFLENVKGLLSADNGNCFGTIICSLDELGYDVEWQVLNSKNFGVPQNRERVFIIGHLRGKPFREIFPLKKNNKEYRSVGGTSDEGQERSHGTTLKGRQRNYGAGELFIVPEENDGGDIMPVQIGHSKDAWASKYGTSIGSQEEAYTIRKEQCNGVMVNKKIRRLTPIEYERLQGFPDGWTDGVSDSQRYKCLGNAVTVNVIEAIGESILNNVREG